MNSSGRYSIRPFAIDQLMKAAEEFGTTDISELILAVCIQRETLLRCLNAQPVSLPPVPENSPESATLAEFAGLLD